MNAVLLAFRLVLAVEDGLEILSRDVLEGLGAANVASIRIYPQEGLDFRDASDDPTYGDESTEMRALHVANCHCDVGLQRLKVQVAAQDEWKAVKDTARRLTIASTDGLGSLPASLLCARYALYADEG